MTAQIEKKVRADQLAFKVKMHDDVVSYYANPHPKPNPGQEDIYLTHPDVIVLAGEPI